jgi:hypothetical protein
VRHAKPVVERTADGRRRGLRALCAGFLVALAGCGSDESKPTAPVGGDGHFVEAREGEPFRHLVVEGTPYEMGFHQGRLLKDEIWRKRIPTERETGRAYAIYVPEFRKLLGVTVAEELRGIAMGAGVDADVLLFEEVADDVVRWQAATDRRRSSCGAALASAPGATPVVGVAYESAPDSPFDVRRWDTTISPDAERDRYSGSPLVLIERRPTGGIATLVVGEPGSLGGWAGISSRGIVIASCEDDSLPSERRSLRGVPFAAGVRLALEQATDAQLAFDALPRLVGNRVLVADATNQRIDALVGLSVVGMEKTEPNAWVLRPASEANKQAQDRRLGNYSSRPGPEDAVDLAVAGRSSESRFPALLWTKDGVEATDATGKTFVYRWSK